MTMLIEISRGRCSWPEMHPPHLWARPSARGTDIVLFTCDGSGTNDDSG